MGYFISYAQNHEDVMLYRALREVKNGFYIDVGAQDPVIDSVTKAFYDRGWRGINIEPNEEYFLKLKSERPHDINLPTAIGCEPGVISFYEVEHTGLSTIDAEYARRHAEAGYAVRSRNVPCTTLDQVCADCGVESVHFLKIDVEGSERAVLEGFSFETIRPWIVVIEATEPNTDREVFSEWEDLLVERRYGFVYFDGLNRFYLAQEHADLARYLSTPPNPFDQYVSYRLWKTNADLDQVRAAETTALSVSLNHMLAEVQQRTAKVEALRTELEDVRTQLEDVRTQLEQSGVELENARNSLAAKDQRLRAIRSSWSWQLTKPLREIRRAGLRVAHFISRGTRGEDSNSSQSSTDQIAAGLAEPARLVYSTLRDTVRRRRRWR